MALNAVVMASEVHLICTAHALSTEVEEIMGLLIGWSNREKGICYIAHCVQLKRIDKRKDRVEISDEQLASTFTILERLNRERKNRRSERPDLEELERLGGDPSSELSGTLKESSAEEELRVVGWYHSHPHITVNPSEVDIRTQKQYQQSLDDMWVGLIFGVYHTDSKHFSSYPYIAFQASTEQDFPMEINGFAQDDLNEAEGGGMALASSTPQGNGQNHRLIPVLCLPQKKKTGGIGEEGTGGLKELSSLVLEESEEALVRKGVTRGTGSVWEFHNAAVYNQAVCKVMGRLTKPLIEAFLTKSQLVIDKSVI